MSINVETSTPKGGKDEALDTLKVEYQRLSAEMRDITTKVDASRAQVEQLAQRNAAVVGEIKKVESSLEQTPRTAIKEAYTEALNTQQRLMTLRGQLEKLQAQETTIRQSAEALKSAIDLMSKSDGDASKSGGVGALNPREMIIRVIDAQEEERDRLSVQMHDGPAHSLSNFILQAEICQKLFDKNPDKAREELANLMSSARDSFQRVREFIFELHPMMLGDLGLAPTIKRYMEAFQSKSGIETEFNMNGRERRLAGYLEVLIFRGVQELMVNARDHGRASNVKVTLEMGSDRVRAMVEDNGQGFGTGQLKLDENNSETLGLSTLQERVHLVGGSLQIDSVQGQGARIELEVPVAEEEEGASDKSE